MKKVTKQYEVALFGATLLPFKRGIETGAAIVLGAGISALAGTTGSAITNSANAAAVDETNNSNLQAVRETNAINAQNVKDTNATNLAIANANNNRQIQLQREMNKYNSLAEQIKRAREAGVNPNAILNGSVSGNLQTTLPQLETPTMQSPLAQAFHALTQQFENPTAEFANNFDKIAQGVSQMKANLSESNLKTKLGNYQDVINDYVEEKQKLGIEIDKASLNNFVANASKAWQEMYVAKQTAMQVQAMVQSINLDNYDKAMRNIFSKEFYEAGVKQAISICHVNETQAHVMMKMLPFQMGLAKAQANQANSSASYLKALESLTEDQRRVLQEQANFLEAQSFSEWLNAGLKADTYNFEVSSAKSRAAREGIGIRQDKENVETSKWHNTGVYRFGEWFSHMSGAIGAAVGGFIGSAKGSMKKATTPDVKPKGIDLDKFNEFQVW